MGFRCLWPSLLKNYAGKSVPFWIKHGSYVDERPRQKGTLFRNSGSQFGYDIERAFRGQFCPLLKQNRRIPAFLVAQSILIRHKYPPPSESEEESLWSGGHL